MSFVQRQLTITFQLGTNLTSGAQPTFTESGTDTVTLSGLRCSAHIEKAGGLSMGTLQLRVYGMTRSLMQQLSTLGQLIKLVGVNTVTVKAGDAGATPSIAFIGTINNAWMDAQAMPEVAFQISASTSLAQAIVPAQGSSFNGGASVDSIMRGLATAMGYRFENNGVTAVLSYPTLWGSARNQYIAAAIAADCEMVIDDDTLAIWPKGGSRGGDPVVVSPTTGLVGYPSFTSNGLMLKTLYNPAIKYGALIGVDSSITPPQGLWRVLKLDHDLESSMPGGQWFSTIGAYNLAFQGVP